MKFTIHQIFFHSECCEIKHGRKVVSRTGYIVILTCTVALFRKPNTLFFICFSTSDVPSKKNHFTHFTVQYRECRELKTTVHLRI